MPTFFISKTYITTCRLSASFPSLHRQQLPYVSCIATLKLDLLPVLGAGYEPSSFTAWRAEKAFAMPPSWTYSGSTRPFAFCSLPSPGSTINSYNHFPALQKQLEFVSLSHSSLSLLVDQLFIAPQSSSAYSCHPQPFPR